MVRPPAAQTPSHDAAPPWMWRTLGDITRAMGAARREGANLDRTLRDLAERVPFPMVWWQTFGAHRPAAKPTPGPVDAVSQAARTAAIVIEPGACGTHWHLAIPLALSTHDDVDGVLEITVPSARCSRLAAVEWTSVLRDVLTAVASGSVRPNSTNRQPECVP